LFGELTSITWNDDEDTTIYHVVVNHEEQYSTCETPWSCHGGCLLTMKYVAAFIDLHLERNVIINELTTLCVSD